MLNNTTCDYPIIKIDTWMIYSLSKCVRVSFYSELLFILFARQIKSVTNLKRSSLKYMYPDHSYTFVCWRSPCVFERDSKNMIRKKNTVSSICLPSVEGSHSNRRIMIVTIFFSLYDYDWSFFLIDSSWPICFGYYLLHYKKNCFGLILYLRKKVCVYQLGKG